MQSGEEHARAARWLLASTLQGVLSTHSLEHPGYPFGSAVPYALDHQGFPLLLLSHLSQHTRNLEADTRCGLTILEAGSGDVQTRSRLSLIGDVLGIEATADVECYFDYFPHTRTYHEQLGFRFYRFQPLRCHWNAGFATARWLAAGRVFHPNPLHPDTEARIVAHMNRDHADALRGYLHDESAAAAGAPAVMLGIDAEGIDLRLADRLYRVALPRAIATADDAHAVLVEMASDA